MYACLSRPVTFTLCTPFAAKIHRRGAEHPEVTQRKASRGCSRMNTDKTKQFTQRRLEAKAQKLEGLLLTRQFRRRSEGLGYIFQPGDPQRLAREYLCEAAGYQGANDGVSHSGRDGYSTLTQDVLAFPPARNKPGLETVQAFEVIKAAQ